MQLTGSARRGRLWPAVRYRGPGVGKRPVRLSIAWYWRQDLRQVLTALQVAGATVDVRAGPRSSTATLAPAIQRLSWPINTTCVTTEFAVKPRHANSSR